MPSRFSQGLKSLGTEETSEDTALTQQRAPRSATVKGSKSKAQTTPVSGYIAPSRHGKKAITGYYDKAVRQQLAILAAEEERSQSDLLAEALNMLFEKYGKPPIAGS